VMNERLPPRLACDVAFFLLGLACVLLFGIPRSLLALGLAFPSLRELIATLLFAPGFGFDLCGSDFAF